MKVTDEQRATALESFKTMEWCRKHNRSKVGRERAKERIIGAAQVLRDLGFSKEELNAVMDEA